MVGSLLRLLAMLNKSSPGKFYQDYFFAGTFAIAFIEQVNVSS